MSHHSSDEGPTREMHEAMKRVFGEFPNGKLNDQDEGALVMAVAVENGAVKLTFPKPIAWIGFTPEQAIQLAQDLIQRAREAGFKSPFTIRL